MTPVIALMRERNQAERSAVRLVARGFSFVIAPATVVRSLAAEPSAGQFDAVVATSARAFVHGGAQFSAALAGLPLYGVGERGHEAAATLGLAFAAAPARDVAALIEILRTRLPAKAQVLYLAGRDRLPDFEDAMQSAGHVVTVVETYAADARDQWTAEEAGAVASADAFLHYSHRSAGLTVELAARAGLLDRMKSRPHVCLSREAAKPLAAVSSRRVFWPHEPNEESLLDTLESALADWIPR